MADAVTPPAALTDAEKAIDSEIRAGFPNEQERLGEALRVLDYFHLRGGKYIPLRRGESSRDWSDRAKQTHPLTRRVVKILCSKTYSPGPARSIEDDDAADQVLQEVYRDNLIDQLMGAADEMATLLYFAAIQVVDLGSETLKPTQLRLWDASQLVLYADPADPTRCASLVTIDRVDCRTRYRWWTDRFCREYLTDKWSPGVTSGARTSKFEREIPHTYGRLPFGLVFHERPTSTLTGDALGPFLIERNAAIDVKIDRMDAAVVAYHAPSGYVHNAPPNWDPRGKSADGLPTTIGDLIRVPPQRNENGVVEVRIEYPQPNLDIESGHLDIEKTIDTVMEGLGVPQTLYRMDQASLPSGESQKAEQQPLVDYTEKRRELFKSWETDLAEAILAVVGVKPDQAAAKEAGTKGLNLTLRWPPEDPTMEEMQADQMAVQEESASLVMLVQKRNRFANRDEALQHLNQVAEDNKALDRIDMGPLAARRRQAEFQARFDPAPYPNDPTPSNQEPPDGGRDQAPAE